METNVHSLATLATKVGHTRIYPTYHLTAAWHVDKREADVFGLFHFVLSLVVYQMIFLNRFCNPGGQCAIPRQRINQLVVL
jgi:hypothetical protein